MNRLAYISGLILSAILGLGSFFMIIFSVSPQSVGIGLKVLVYVSLFAGAASAATLAAYLWFGRLGKSDFHRLAGLSLVEGIFLSAILVAIVLAISNALFFGPIGMAILSALVLGQIIILKNENKWNI